MNGAKLSWFGSVLGDPVLGLAGLALPSLQRGVRAWLHLSRQGLGHLPQTSHAGCCVMEMGRSQAQEGASGQL